MTDSPSELKASVLHNLGVGRVNALQGKALAKILGEKDTRRIRLSIQELIVDGHPIIGSAKPPYGYYIAENAQECQDNLEALSSYLKMLGRHRKYLQAAAFKHFSGQMKMRV